MKVVKDVSIQFNPTKLFNVMLDDLFDIGIIAARRMEDEAKMNLDEGLQRENISKSSGALRDSIQGVVKITPGFVWVAITASATETGQWESSMGEYEAAESAKSTPLFDYASAVEEGTGIYGPKGEPISSPGGNMMSFWTGQYRETKRGEQVKKLMKKKYIKGQPPKRFLQNALDSSYPFVVNLMGKVGTKIKIVDFTD